MATEKKEDWIVYGMLNDQIGFEKSYDRILIVYLNKNPGTQEKDFLLLLIRPLNEILIQKKEFNEAIKFKKDEDIRKELIEDGLPKYSNIEDWILDQIKKRKEPKSIRKEENLLTLIKIKLSRLPNNNAINLGSNNPHPETFRDYETFLIFKKYKTKYYLDPYKDLSFIFQKLKAENRILKTKHLEFALFLLSENFISEKIYRIISDQKGFDNKSSSAARLNNYNNIISEIDSF